MSRRTRKWIVNALRILICVGALWLVGRGVTLRDHVVLSPGGRELVGTITEHADRIEIRLVGGTVETIAPSDVARRDDGTAELTYGLLTAWRSGRKDLLAVGVLIMLIVPLFLAQRLKWLLAVQDIKITLWQGVKLSFAGNFLNFATPLGSNAGDVFKAYFVSMHTGHKTEAMTTVLLDRLIGLVTLVVVVGLLTALSPSGSRLAELRLFVIGCLAAGAVVLTVYLSQWLRRLVVPDALALRLPMRDQLERIDRTGRTLLAHKAILVASVLITLCLQAVSVTGYIVVAAAMGMDVRAETLMAYYAYFLAGAVVQALPGPPQGLGTVELTYRYFLAPFGTVSQIVCVALLIRIVVFAASLPGLIVTLTGSYKPGRKPDPDTPFPARWGGAHYGSLAGEVKSAVDGSDTHHSRVNN
ncbi:MAG: lysylphosphatidylglycerol synthase transmembrane domain-containing protein [Phycisphaerae bacterium]